MQFLIIAYDGKDPAAFDRRMAARAAHIRLGDQLRDEGHLHFGTAILDDNRNMIGSMPVAEYATREELDAWLSREPYVTGAVWKEIEVRPCRVGPSFARKGERKAEPEETQATWGSDKYVTDASMALWVKIKVGEAPNRGPGVFAEEPFGEGDLIEACPAIVIPPEQRAALDGTVLYNYYFSWGADDAAAAISMNPLCFVPSE